MGQHTHISIVISYTVSFINFVLLLSGYTKLMDPFFFLNSVSFNELILIIEQLILHRCC